MKKSTRSGGFFYFELEMNIEVLIVRWYNNRYKYSVFRQVTNMMKLIIGIILVIITVGLAFLNPFLAAGLAVIGIYGVSKL